MSVLSQKSQARTRALESVGTVRLLIEDPELFEAVPPEGRQQALRECMAPAMFIRAGDWQPSGSCPATGEVGLLVLEGLMLRRVCIGRRVGAELLGEGDLIRPSDTEDASALDITTSWRALTNLRLAKLSPGAVERLVRYPPLLGALAGKALARARRMSLMMAIVHHPRVDIRLHMLLWHLADRWGRVRHDGVLLPLALSHSVLSELIAAQRPSVTNALGKLTQQQLVTRVPDGWLLTGSRPSELLELQEVTAA